MSGTIGSARLAAAAAAVPVQVIDSGSLGMGLGFAVLSAAEVASAGGSAGQVAAAAARRSARLRSFFTVETPDRLRTGGRLGHGGSSSGGSSSTGAGGAGPGLTARPLLHVLDGQIALLEKVRTRSAALRRLTELAIESAAGQPVDLAVQYLGQPDRAAALGGRLAELIPGAREIYQARADAVIGLHTGQGMLGVVVAPY
jgi:DegV family protein with EDD domain